MLIDLTTLSEQELLNLNRRIVERLNLIRSARSLTELTRFSVGMAVGFSADDGRVIQGPSHASIGERPPSSVPPASGAFIHRSCVTFPILTYRPRRASCPVGRAPASITSTRTIVARSPRQRLAGSEPRCRASGRTTRSGPERVDDETPGSPNLRPSASPCSEPPFPSPSPIPPCKWRSRETWALASAREARKLTE